MGGFYVAGWAETSFLGNVIPVVYAKLISRKGTVYNTTKCIYIYIYCIPSLPDLFCVTRRWPLVAETCM